MGDADPIQPYDRDRPFGPDWRDYVAARDRFVALMSRGFTSALPETSEPGAIQIRDAKRPANEPASTPIG
jgi:hypothetical protein